MFLLIAGYYAKLEQKVKFVSTLLRVNSVFLEVIWEYIKHLHCAEFGE